MGMIIVSSLLFYSVSDIIPALLIQALLCSVWGPLASTAIFSLAPQQLLTKESLNGAAEIENPKQANTVPCDPDLETDETDPVTDGGTQESSQTALTSPATPFSNNETHGVKKILILKSRIPSVLVLNNSSF